MLFSFKPPRHAWLAGLALVFAAPGSVMAQQLPIPNGGVPAQPRLDVGKGRIELSTKKLYAAHAELARAANPQQAEDNPRVEPGKVNWHPTFEAAVEASKKSGKPVLLFQMMGRLDQKFC